MNLFVSLDIGLLVPLILAMLTMGVGLFVYYEAFVYRPLLARFRRSKVTGILSRRKWWQI